jgi:hypothetical protein
VAFQQVLVADGKSLLVRELRFATHEAGIRLGQRYRETRLLSMPNWVIRFSLARYRLGELAIREVLLTITVMPFSPIKPSDDADFLLAGMGFIANSTDPKVAIAKLVEAAASALGSDMGSFYVLHADENVLKPYVTFNFPEAYLAGCSAVRVGQQCCGRAAKYKLPWIVEDMWTDPLFEEARDAAKKAGIRAGFSVPVLDVNGNCFGSLASHFRKTFKPSIYELERQSIFAKLIGFALVKHGVVQPTKITSQSHRANTSFEAETATG